MREILFIAGEPSGDLHASSVARELSARVRGKANGGGEGASFRLTGVGGDLMQDAGVQVDQHIRDLAVLGFVEVIRHIPKHWRMLRDVRARLRSGNVALVILVDYPGFNMRVAEAAAQAGVPVLYYIVPQVWAWGSDRLEKLARWVTTAAVILPFEEDLLRQHGVNATFVGHPLLDRAVDMPDRARARDQLGVPHDARVLALFPGSRAQEIHRHLGPFVETATILRERDRDLRVLVSAAPHVKIDEQRCPFPVLRASSLPILRAADAAMCKSGTTTLEASVALCPHVVAYRTHPLTYFAAKRLVKIPYIGLVNVVAGRMVAREFIQEGLQPPAVARALETLLDPRSAERKQMLSDLDVVRRLLGQPGAARRVADIARTLAEGKSA